MNKANKKSLSIGDLIDLRLDRRDALKGMGGAAIVAGATGVMPLMASAPADAAEIPNFSFTGINHGVDETHHVAEGYSADVLIRWGDPIFADAPPFDPYNQFADAQEMQFGFNNDFLGYVPLEGSNRGLLCVNHEYTKPRMMFPNPTGKKKPIMIEEMMATEQAAHGGSVIEIANAGDGWKVITNSRYNRRISARSTEIELTGPAAGHDRLKTSADPSGTRVTGMLNNCSGGITPWGTWLSGEENFNKYFSGDLTEDHPEYRNYRTYGLPRKKYSGWGKYTKRFDINEEPLEANRFGWVVEIDPKDPASMPKKRTALGRFKHEGAANLVSKDGRVVVYMGDDQKFQYVYKFVTKGVYDPSNHAANRDLLDEGTLYVARFEADGTVNWMALIQGQGPLTADIGFSSQADVMIETRRAAKELGATPMDRPEDIEANPVTGQVYVMLTNNTKRTEKQIDGANPRANNIFGHILEMVVPDGDHGASTSTWDILVRCGDPKEDTGAEWHPDIGDNGWFASPDNCAIDHQGRLWIATDQGSKWRKTETADGLWALETVGGKRGLGWMFFRVPVGAEMCGPTFTPDDQTLFVAIQHPASDGTKHYPGFERTSTFDDPATRWPDFVADMPPRPSVVVITKNGGGKIGG